MKIQRIIFKQMLLSLKGTSAFWFVGTSAFLNGTSAKCCSIPTQGVETAFEAIPDLGRCPRRVTPVLPSHGVGDDAVGGLEPAELGLRPGARPRRVLPRWRQGCHDTTFIMLN